MFARWVSRPAGQHLGRHRLLGVRLPGRRRRELAYQDECHLYVYDGKTGTKMLELINSSSDGPRVPAGRRRRRRRRRRIDHVANLSEPVPNAACGAADPDYMPRKGVFVLPPAPTRGRRPARLWTQHTHHVTNVDPNGNVPMMEQDNWKTPELNNFRQGEQTGCK
jgi:hypothetical protein